MSAASVGVAVFLQTNAIVMVMWMQVAAAVMRGRLVVIINVARQRLLMNAASVGVVEFLQSNAIVTAMWMLAAAAVKQRRLVAIIYVAQP